MKTLTEALKEFPEIAQDPAHWAEYGITTAEGFYQYLDACVEKEKMDQLMYGDE